MPNTWIGSEDDVSDLEGRVGRCMNLFSRGEFVEMRRTLRTRWGGWKDLRCRGGLDVRIHLGW